MQGVFLDKGRHAPKYMFIQEFAKINNSVLILMTVLNFFLFINSTNSTNICTQLKTIAYYTGYIYNMNPPLCFQIMQLLVTL